MKRKEVKMTDLQKRIYGVIAEKDGITREDVAKLLDAKVREVTPPIYALIRDGVVAKDDASNTFSAAAGVEEEGENIYIVSKEEEEPDFGDYTPEELVTFYGSEGIDYLKRKALVDALKAVPGVGAKSEVCILHIFDADLDVRVEPTELMKALEDCGIKKALLGRIVREVFLVEKLYGSYLKEGSDIVIDQRRRRVNREGRTFIRDTGYERERERGHRLNDPNYGDDLDYRDRERDVDERPPRWYSELKERLGEAKGRTSAAPKPYATVEPVLDKHGKPVEDPNNPGHYLEKRVIYSDDGDDDVRSRSRRFQSRFDEGDDTGARGVVTKTDKEIEALRDEVAKLRDLLQEHETDKKIDSAVGPLMDKIHALESRKSGSSTGAPLSDTQFKAQSERETIELITETAERNVERMLSPIVEAQGALQKFQMLQQVIMMEKLERVPSGTYLKYLSPVPEDISKDRVQDTLKKLRGK